MGATSDVDIMCQNSPGDNGKFYTAPEGNCQSNDFTDPNAEYITDDAAGDTKNFTDADGTTGAGLSKVFACIALLGQSGCGFEHQLASIDRALGSDGAVDGNGNLLGPTDPTFLRPDAYLGIVMLTNEDDCSAPNSGNTALDIYSLQGGDDSLNSPGGPLGNYRCNGKPYGGHRCQDLSAGSPDMTPQLPPLDEPTDAVNDMVTYSNCVPDDGADPMDELIPVATFISHIKSLKSDPANQILVAAVTGVNHTDPANPNTVMPTSTTVTPTPYTVTWALGSGTSATEKIPNVNHLCGPTTDGSFADPAVRISAFVNAFGTNGVLDSICDASYAPSMTAIAQKIGALITPKCISGTIQQLNGQPNCTVTNEFKVNGSPTQLTKNIPNCASTSPTGTAPCWQFLAAGDPNNKCGGIGQALSVSTDPSNPTPDSLDSLIQCSTCVPNVPTAGCPCLGTSADVAGCL